MIKKGVAAALLVLLKLGTNVPQGLDFISEKNILLNCPQSTPLVQISSNFVSNCYVCSGQ